MRQMELLHEYMIKHILETEFGSRWPTPEEEADFLLRQKEGLADKIRQVLPPSDGLEAVMEAFMSIRREDFVPGELMEGLRLLTYAYFEKPLPIPHYQSISAPLIVALMLLFLDVQPKHKILEVGTGSLYNAAMLGRLAKDGHVYSIEYVSELAQSAQAKLTELGIANISVVQDDGCLGYPPAAPFDRIIVTASTPKHSQAITLWSEQLSDDGRMVVPVNLNDREPSDCYIMLFSKHTSEQGTRMEASVVTQVASKEHEGGGQYELAPLQDGLDKAAQFLFVPLQGSCGFGNSEGNLRVD